MPADSLPEAIQSLLDDLTQKQANFVIGLVDGKSQAKAYMGAGYAANGEESASTLANRLLKKVTIRDALNSLRAYTVEQAASKAILTRAEALEELTKVARMTPADFIEAEAPLGNKINAINAIVKMEGWSEPEKLQIDIYKPKPLNEFYDPELRGQSLEHDSKLQQH